MGGAEILHFDGSDIALTNGSSVITATNTLSTTVSVAGSTATIAVAGASLSNAQTQTLIDGLAYRNASDHPSTVADRTVTITSVTDSGGTAAGGDDTASLAITSTISLTAVNDSPVIGDVFGETSQVNVGAGLQDLRSLDRATVSNADSVDYNGGFLTLGLSAGQPNQNWGLDGVTATAGGDGLVSAGESVSVGGVVIGTVDVTDDGQGGNDFTINLTANASSDRIQALLRALAYSAPSGVETRTHTLTLNDADGIANGGDEDSSGTFFVEVVPPNTSPNVTPLTAISIVEDAVAQTLPNDVDISDADANDQTVTVTVTSGSIGLTVAAGLTSIDGNGDDGAIVFSGSLTDVNAALDGLTFTPTPNSVGSVTLQISSEDGRGGSDSAITELIITDLQPVISDASFAISPEAVDGTRVGDLSPKFVPLA